MDLLDRFTQDFLALPGIYNPVARERQLFGFWKPFYKASVDAAGFELLIILEPLSEEAEVLNNIASFRVQDGKFCDISFDVDHQILQIPDIQIDESGCLNLLDRLKAFCEQALPSEDLPL